MLKPITREEWLLLATERLRAGIFKDAGAEVPPIKVSVGFPVGNSRNNSSIIGQIWHAQACADSIPQIFISPVLDEAERALDVLTHELVHACTPGAGHGKAFKHLALAVGLEGKMTATTASPALKAKLTLLTQEIGPYPHSKLNISGRKKQGTRLLKCECNSCGYTVRVTAKWIDASGPPICPECMERMGAE